MHLRLIDPKSARERTFSRARSCLSPAKCLSAVLKMQLPRVDNCCVSSRLSGFTLGIALAESIRTGEQHENHRHDTGRI